MDFIVTPVKGMLHVQNMERILERCFYYLQMIVLCNILTINAMPYQQYQTQFQMFMVLLLLLGSKRAETTICVELPVDQQLKLE